MLYMIAGFCIGAALGSGGGWEAIGYLALAAACAAANKLIDVWERHRYG